MKVALCNLFPCEGLREKNDDDDDEDINTANISVPPHVDVIYKTISLRRRHFSLPSDDDVRGAHDCGDFYEASQAIYELRMGE